MFAGAWEEWQQLPDTGLWPNDVQFSSPLNGVMVPQFPLNEDKAPSMTVWVTQNGGARAKDWASVKLPSWPMFGKNSIYMKNETIVLMTQLGACISSNSGKSFDCKNATISGEQLYLYVGTFLNATFGVGLATDLKTQKDVHTVNSRDGGMTWNVVAPFEPAVAISKIVLLSDQVYFVNYWSNGGADNMGGFVYTEDGGKSWHNATNGEIPWDQLYNDFDVMVTSPTTAELWTVSSSNGVVYHASIDSSKKLVQLDTLCHNNG